METCVLCNSPDNDLKTDHIREAYKINKDKLSNSQYHPKLFQDEMSKLISGSNPICSNRKKCRQRQAQLLLETNSQREKENIEIQFHYKKIRASKKPSFAKINGKKTSIKKANIELEKFSGRTPTNIKETDYYSILTYLI